VTGWSAVYLWQHTLLRSRLGLLSKAYVLQYICTTAVIVWLWLTSCRASAQALPVKMLAIGVTGALANLPCGAWRVHTRKFSPGWFLAVHATIPFIAILRKAVVMPRWAIALTVAAAVVGQFAGARLERRRLACVAHERAAGGGTGCRRAAGAGALLAPLPLAAGLLRQGAGLVMAV